MRISSRQELKTYCLRSLGAPVINIEVEDGQLNDRIDDALDTFYERHFDATERLISMIPITEDNLNDGYVTLDDSYYEVIRVLNNYGTGGGSHNLSYDFQFKLKHLNPFEVINNGMVSYQLKRTKLSDLDMMFSGSEEARFNKHSRRLRLTADQMEDGFVVLEAYIINEESETTIYNDKWFKDYCKALFKQQWGQNLLKHKEIEMLGGITVAGRELYEDALQEIERLDERLNDRYQEPPQAFFIG